VKHVRLSSSASAYVKSEAAYLRARSIPAAQRFLDHLKQLKRNLTEYPHMGHVSQDALVPGVLRFAMAEYLIDYEIVGDCVHLLAIRHSAQRPPDLAVDRDDFEDYEA
jgi:plasmid stabilization system protein ParE